MKIRFKANDGWLWQFSEAWHCTHLPQVEPRGSAPVKVGGYYYTFLQ